ncbi:MAG: hypothetical protein GY810_26480 [Aureispira sp.]|nr:hypothetical protein [Aureispira sp.]
MKKTIIVLTSFVLLSSLFVACGDKPTDETGNTTDEQVEELELLSRDELYKAQLFESLEEANKEPEKVVRLKLKPQDLGKFPEEIFKMTNLQELTITGNKIEELPAQISNLKKLEHLKLGGNPIKAVPESIGKLRYLKTFELNNAELATSGYPASIANLKMLERFTCVSCDLTKFPVEITQLPNLKNVNLNSNEITVIPVEIGNMKSIEELGLMFNKATILPKEIGNLSNLKRLLLTSTPIEEIPENIGELAALNDLSLDKNNLKFLPATMSKLTALRTLSIGGNKAMDYAQAITVVNTIASLESLNMGSMKGMGANVSLPKEIAACPAKRLDLGFNVFDNPDADFALLAQMPNLNNLSLFGCKLTAIPKPLFGMKKLTYLSLSSNKEIPQAQFNKLVKALPDANIPDIYK